MKEILKEIAPGVFTHDYWADDDGNRILDENLVEVTVESKIAELWNAYQTELYTTLEYNSKVYGNSKDDQQTVDDAIWAISENLFPVDGMPWHTYLGAETVMLKAQDIKGLKFASVMKKQQLFGKYSGLEAQAKSATTEEELKAIKW